MELDTPTALDNSLSWFGMRVRSNFERVAAQHLESRGFEPYCPSYKTEKLWSDRKKIVDQVLFPGYLFCRLDLQQRIHAMTVPGVVGLVGFGQTFPAIPEVEIERVRAMVDSGLPVMPWPFLREGQRVLIERGPLAGVEGTLLQSKGQFRLVVSISLLQRSVSAEIDRRWVRPISSPVPAHAGVPEAQWAVS
jgi:transcription antitermination factor NusG